MLLLDVDFIAEYLKYSTEVRQSIEIKSFDYHSLDFPVGYISKAFTMASMESAVPATKIIIELQFRRFKIQHVVHFAIICPLLSTGVKIQATEK